MEAIDVVLLFFVLVAFGFSLANMEKDGIPAIVFAVWGGLIRIRMLVRAIRTDALIREEEAEVAKLAPTTQTTGPVTRSVTCPNCHIPIPIPADYSHSNTKCPHCAHVFRIV